MNLRLVPSLALPLVVLGGCFPPPLVDYQCESAETCDTTQPDDDTTAAAPHTTGGALDTDISAGGEGGAGSTADAEGGDTSDDTTGGPTEPPAILEGVVTPDYIDDNGLLTVEVRTANAVEGVRMQLDSGAPIELEPEGRDKFTGQIPAFTGLDKGPRTAVLTPWRAKLEGESVAVGYVNALPEPGTDSGAPIDGPGGRVAAIALLPDGRPVEFGTFNKMGTPRCYLHLRDKRGGSVEFIDLLPLTHCTAVDLKIDRDSGRMHLLAEHKQVNDIVWSVSEISAWGMTPIDIGAGVVGDTAYALAARPELVAVCGARAVPTPDQFDALAVLLRPGQPPEPRVFDYLLPSSPMAHKFGDTAHDCAFAGDTLVLVGETHGRHDKGGDFPRDRHIVIESDVLAAKDPAWTVAGIALGVNTRAFALDLDAQGRYHLVGDKCDGTCEPEGELWTYESGGALVDHGSIGPLGSSWFGPHDIAWSPAGYAVVAYGAMQGQTPVFKVQAFAPGVPLPLWTGSPSNPQDLQLARAVAVGPFGEVYAGGIAVDDQPAFKRIAG